MICLPELKFCYNLYKLHLVTNVLKNAAYVRSNEAASIDLCKCLFSCSDILNFVAEIKYWHSTSKWCKCLADTSVSSESLWLGEAGGEGFAHKNTYTAIDKRCLVDH